MAKRSTTTATPRTTKQTTIIGFTKKTPQPPSKPNASILTFFKKEPVEPALFVQGRTFPQLSISDDRINTADDILFENDLSPKRRRTSGSFQSSKPIELLPAPPLECTPPPNDDDDDKKDARRGIEENTQKRNRPFVEDSDSEDSDSEKLLHQEVQVSKGFPRIGRLLPQPSFNTPGDDCEKEEDLALGNGVDFEEFKGVGDFEEEQGEEYMAYDDDDDDNDDDNVETQDLKCPLCGHSITGLTEDQATLHVNQCLDGLDQVPEVKQEIKEELIGEQIKELPLLDSTSGSKRPVPFRPPKPGQMDPMGRESTSQTHISAFSKLMAGHAEDEAWSSAAAAEHAARGKPAYQRTCPFYKIMPGLSITVDAFRYGAVEGCNAYFLSHFHSDHYIGLTSTWSHGPIYCSKITANLVKQQLKVFPEYVVALEFEKETIIPNTDGVRVTMISANHCPGSSLFLFEKIMPTKGLSGEPKMQRILHCGDFRACQAHIEHPLLKPTIEDSTTRRLRKQMIDICYLDTTYLNPKYAFPPQSDVIKAAADLCFDINSQPPNDLRANGASSLTTMSSFLTSKSTKSTSHTVNNPNPPTTDKSRVLIIVGTYSIGKERICVAIAQRIGSKIYATAAKRAIVSALDDAELSALITSDPTQAQVHMVALFELRPETLADYLATQQTACTTAGAAPFTHAVGFRPTGWTFRGPAGRTDVPPVPDVLRGRLWRSTVAARDLMPQRGSTPRAAVYGVPYSEHSSFRELTAFVCGLHIARVVPTVNVGSAKAREMMRAWVERWEAERRKNGLFKAVDW